MTGVRDFFGRISGRQITSSFVLFVLAAAPALAQDAQPSPADSPTGWVFRWINFAIVFALIVYAFRKAGPAFHARTEEISQKIAEGTRAREAAEKQKREAQQKLAGIATDVAAMRVEAKRGAELETERLRELAKSEAAMIERAAQAEIEAAERAARLELKALAARMAVERAEVVLKQELNPKMEAALFGTFVAELQESVN